MNYKGFTVDWSEKDKIFIISTTTNEYIKDIVGHTETIQLAQNLIDFYHSVVETKERF